ncbi:hypothetical protein Purlil1_13540 [Purpureocillium lilacinum]|uniref:Uncharacterized protein n=1 Tax=Purpureocillium lilacinum TaxID=33203 RepID=A0ABR0BDU0_PURLI|nr:hypothetical protein Purlil1_13540 [Purpureocillium lilacinum]
MRKPVTEERLHPSITGSGHGDPDPKTSPRSALQPPSAVRGSQAKRSARGGPVATRDDKNDGWVVIAHQRHGGGPINGSAHGMGASRAHLEAQGCVAPG